ncbi:hypothetical protein PV08_01179 [Exophiala spinifera]|uniref:AB hydrolase-1 domain-containing protein n=1 Tax=Exophiala spinifera TaxID=91928 RepID=A0A0D2CAK8_9EURO|nr:uncharacterized protein PV08_01179 [Exophiala spinifera]KIW20604.1 hypothetical protein PV08_01179 [Exophiala spinifera]
MAYTHQDSPSTSPDPTSLPPLPLPEGVTSRFVDTSPHSLVFHVLESLPSRLSAAANTKPPLIILCHGFPEIAYSWRKILPLLSAKGYHAVAFDQRGYGRTFSRQPLAATSFSPTALIKDTITLVSALGYTHAAAIVGHDFGAVTATYCALARPDIFHRLVLMSHPFAGPPSLPFNTSPSYDGQSTTTTSTTTTPSAAAAPANEGGDESKGKGKYGEVDIHTALAQLARPRKHYKWYYCTPGSNAEMTYPTGSALHDFLRGYFHLKSADWDGNSPHALAGWTAAALAQMPRYYVMDLADTMREAVARDMASEDPDVVTARAGRWLPDPELAVYADEWARTTFQGGLNWYRIQTVREIAAEMTLWSGAKLSVPTVFVSGSKDWGTFQEPGAVEAMETGKSVKGGMYRGTVLVDGAGHWVNQEQPARCVEEILGLIDATSSA